MKLPRRLLYLAAWLPSVIVAQEPEQESVLPNDFAFTRLIDQGPGSGTGVCLPKFLDPKAVVLLAGNQVVLFKGPDAVAGLRGEGMKILTVPKTPMEPQVSFVNGQATPMVRTSQTMHSKNELGFFVVYREEKKIAFAGINRGEGLTGWTELEWKPAPVACYRSGKLLGIWDTQIRKLRSVEPDEAPATIQATSLQEAVIKGLPSPARKWTDARGRTLQARVTEYDPGKQTITIDIIGKRVIKDFPMQELSPEDRSYIIIAYNMKAAFPEDFGKMLGEALR